MRNRFLFAGFTAIILFITINSCNRQAGKGSITENFEQSGQTKSKSYSKTVISFKSGPWLLDDALIGTSDKDIKNGSQSVRIRNKGKLAMQFDAANISNVSIKYAAYGNDKSSGWQVWVSYNQGSSYRQIGETITADNHSLQQWSAGLTVNSTIRLEIRKISGGKNRINIDDIVLTERTGQEITNTISDTNSTNLTFADTVAGDNGNLLLGNPSSATVNSATSADNYLINHHYYTESYNKTKVEPNWVSWHIGASDITGKRGPEAFRADTKLPANWFVADNTYYQGSGFDKGHNCPSGDRTSTSDANSATFLMDNIIPQAPNNNQHTWEHLESYCRSQVKNGDEVYVIMGSYGSGGTGKNGFATSIYKGRINVPAHIWKVVIIIPNGNHDMERINADTKIIAVDTPNDNNITSNWMNYVCIVRDIEKATGYNLLSALPQAVQDTLEVKRFSGF